MEVQHPREWGVARLSWVHRTCTVEIIGYSVTRCEIGTSSYLAFSPINHSLQSLSMQSLAVSFQTSRPPLDLLTVTVYSASRSFFFSRILMHSFDHQTSSQLFSTTFPLSPAAWRRALGFGVSGHDSNTVSAGSWHHYLIDCLILSD